MPFTVAPFGGIRRGRFPGIAVERRRLSCITAVCIVCEPTHVIKKDGSNKGASLPGKEGVLGPSIGNFRPHLWELAAAHLVADA
jgi:hypothetical protein